MEFPIPKKIGVYTYEETEVKAEDLERKAKEQESSEDEVDGEINTIKSENNEKIDVTINEEYDGEKLLVTMVI